MKHRHGLPKFLLNRWGTSNREIHPAEFCQVACRMLMLGDGWSRQPSTHNDWQYRRKKRQTLHTVSLSIEVP
jgi:hypothetical protein